MPPAMMKFFTMLEYLAHRKEKEGSLEKRMGIPYLIHVIFNSIWIFFGNNVYKLLSPT